MTGVEEDTFYEDDEPIEKIRAILDREPDGVTAPPAGVAVTASSPTLAGNRTETPRTTLRGNRAERAARAS